MALFQSISIEKPAPTAFERHFAPAELGGMWALSGDTVRRLFDNEPGVLVVEHGKGKGRRYRTMRIPASVAERVHRRLSACQAQQLSIRSGNEKRT